VKQILAALIVALAIVFHAVAPSIFGPPSEVGGWVDSADALVCPSHIAFRNYLRSRMETQWAKFDDPMTRHTTQQKIRERALGVGRECEELVTGQIVRWVPGPPVSLERLPEDAIQHYRDTGTLVDLGNVVLVTYTNKAGVEKRGYTSRSAVRSLAEAAELSK
jgi:hypothetical protein